jgi:hypothetical protein
LTLPHPKLESNPAAPISSALFSSNDTSVEAESPEFAESINAATPDVIGAENEVPDQYPYPPWLVIGMDSPGAAMSTQLPKFEKYERVSAELVELTATALLHAAG